MRRHVENQLEIPERDRLGILALFVMWALALMALSAAAHGEEKQVDQPATIAVNQNKSADIQTANPPTANGREGAPRRLPLAQSKEKKASKADASASSAAQIESNDQVTLTRFILVSIPDRRLALVDNGQVTRIYPIAVGANHTPSPRGNFTIVSRVSNPSWSHKGKVAAPGKNNPVGSRWMGLSLKGYGIHGTNAPRSIGKAASHGCFRMGKKDIEELFALVHVGDTVAVRAERDELVAQVFGDGNGEVQVAAAAVPSADADEQ
jgi:lipoprotein-anchoring transpeptidase ErfK/SrfK